MIVNGVDVEATLNAKANQATMYTKTEIDEQRDIQNVFLDLKAPKASPTFTGTTNATDVTLSGNLSVAGTSKTIMARTIQAPPANNLELAGTVNVGTYLNAPDATISNSLTVNGSLSVNSFFPVKPYFAAYVLSEAISYQFGHVTATLTRPNGTGGVFQFNLPTAHPRGNNYLVIAQIRTGATAGQTFSFCSTNVTSSTAFNVWVRNSSMGSINGDFYVYTVP